MINRREFGTALMGLAGTSIARTGLSTGQKPRTNTLMHVGGDYHNIVGGDITSRLSAQLGKAVLGVWDPSWALKKWGEALGWHKLFGHSFRSHRRILASPSRRRGLGVSINGYETIRSHLPSTENANSTFPGIPPQIAYPEFTKTIPPAIAGPPPSMEPPLASTPLTVI
jgi:hypothetical protein